MGDLSQQNGVFNMTLVQYKVELIKNKKSLMIPLTIEPYDIILMINYAWERFFVRCVGEKRQLLTGDGLCSTDSYYCATINSTMTYDEVEREQETDIIIPYIDTITTANISSSDDPTFDPHFINTPQSSSKDQLRFTRGTAVFCLETIVNSKKLMEARKKIKVKREEGKTVKEHIQSAKKVTPGFLSRTCHLGKTVLDVVKHNHLIRKEK